MSNTINYEYKEHIIEIQKKNEEEFLRELRDGNYTYDNPLVKYNPYLLNSLSAVLLFNSEDEEAFTIVVKGKEKDGDLIHTFPKAKEHVLPILGLYSDYENKIEVWPYQRESEKYEFTIKTPDVDKDKLVISMDTTKQYLGNQIIFSAPANDDLSIGTDYNGDLRLKFERKLIWDLKQTNNGHFWMSSDRLLRLPYVLTGIYEFDLVGKIYKEYRIPNGYHHDQIFLENGDLVVLSGDWENLTVEDRLYVIDRESGEVKDSVNFKDFLKPGAQKSGSWSDEDWFHSNSLWYDKYTNSYTISGRHANALVNIDADSKKLNWIISDPEGWPSEYQKYLFKPKKDQDDFKWQYEQHSVFVTPNGDIGLFDNHHYGSQNPDKYLRAKDSYSRGLIYRINKDKKEIEQSFAYGEDKGYEFFSPYISNMVYYDEGHYLIHSGGIAYDGNGISSDVLGPTLQRHDPKAKLYSHTLIYNKGEEVLNLKTHSNYYRAEKISLYHEGNNLELGEGKILGSIGKTVELDIKIPAKEVDEKLDPSLEAKIEEEFDLFTFYAKFKKGQLAGLSLERGDEEKQYYISTASQDDRGAMCAATFLTSDDRDTRTAISKEGLSGEYKIKVIIDDKKYDTGLTIKA